MRDGVSDAFGVDEAMGVVGLSIFGPPTLGAPREHTGHDSRRTRHSAPRPYDHGTTPRSVTPQSFGINNLQRRDPRNAAQIGEMTADLVKHGLRTRVTAPKQRRLGPGTRRESVSAKTVTNNIDQDATRTGRITPKPPFGHVLEPTSSAILSTCGLERCPSIRIRLHGVAPAPPAGLPDRVRLR